MTNAPELNALLVRFRDDHDVEALARLFDQTAPHLLDVARHVLRDSAAAEDAVQSTFLAVIESARRFDDRRSALGWLVGILEKQAHYAARRARRAPEPARLETLAPPDPSAAAETGEAKDALRAAIDRLPEPYRPVVRLAVDDDLAAHEIGRRLGRAPGTIRVQIHRALALLRSALPVGLASGAALGVLQEKSFAEVRRAVIERAATRAAPPVVAGASIAKLAAALLLAGGAAVGIAIKANGPEELAATPAALEAISTPTDPGDPGAPLPAARASDAPAADPAPRRDPVAADAPAVIPGVVRGDVWLAGGQGIVLATGKVVARDAADIVIGTDNVPFMANRGARIARFMVQEPPKLFAKGRQVDNAARSAAWGTVDQKTLDRHVRAVVAFDPERVRWNNAPVREQPFVVATADDGYAVGAIVDWRRSDDPTGFAYRVTWRFASGAPRFREGAPIPDRDSPAITVDAKAFDDDPIGREIDAAKRAHLSELDSRAKKYGGSTADGFRTRVVALRENAARVTMSDSFDYTAATFSFEHDTRDDVELTHNDWSFEASGAAVHTLRVFLVTDDRSRIFDLGAVDPQHLSPSFVSGRPSSDSSLPFKPGSVYLIRSRDARADRIDVMQVLAVEDERAVVFQWRPIDDEAERAGFDAALRDVDVLQQQGKSLLTGAPIRVQMRGGAGGGNPNQMFVDGSHNAYVDESSDVPLALGSPIDINEPHRAFCSGGLVPIGKNFRVRSVRWTASTKGDTNGPGGFAISIGGQELVRVETSEEPTIGVWNGEIILGPGGEESSFVEIRNSSECDVTIFGELIEDDS